MGRGPAAPLGEHRRARGVLAKLRPRRTRRPRPRAAPRPPPPRRSPAARPPPARGSGRAGSRALPSCLPPPRDSRSPPGAPRARPRRRRRRVTPAWSAVRPGPAPARPHPGRRPATRPWRRRRRRLRRRSRQPSRRPARSRVPTTHRAVPGARTGPRPTQLLQTPLSKSPYGDCSRSRASSTKRGVGGIPSSVSAASRFATQARPQLGVGHGPLEQRVERRASLWQLLRSGHPPLGCGRQSREQPCDSADVVVRHLSSHPST